MTLGVDTFYRIRVKLTSGTNVEVWVDGVSKGTKNTNLPSGILTLNVDGHFAYLITTEAVAKTAHVGHPRVMHDY